jgi:hypothetical protein
MDQGEVSTSTKALMLLFALTVIGAMIFMVKQQADSQSNGARSSLLKHFSADAYQEDADPLIVPSPTTTQ